MPQRDRRTVRRYVHLVLAAAVLGGCGAETPTSGEPPGPKEESGPVVAGLGDSITAGNPGYDPDPDQRAALGFGADERSQYEYWAERSPNLKGSDPFRFRNCGVFGERTNEIAERLDGCAEDATALIIQGGINDIAQGRAVADAAADLRSMVARGKRLGLDVYLVEVLPWNNGHPAADRPIAALNERIATIGAAEGVPVIAWHDALADPDEPTLMAPALTADGDHPSVAGYRRLGELVAAALEPD